MGVLILLSVFISLNILLMKIDFTNKPSKKIKAIGKMLEGATFVLAGCLIACSFSLIFLGG